MLIISSPVRILYTFVNGRTNIDTYQDGVEIAVVVTGCDAGFGKDAAFELSKRGFVVFAGCISLDKSKIQFDGK